MSPKTDESTLQMGSELVCLDATPLIYFNNTGLLDVLREWFEPTAYTPLVVIEEELGQRPKQNADILAAPWLYWVPPHPDDTEFIAGLHRRFQSAKDKNRGEADLIAACRRYGWTAVIDDEDGCVAASDHGVPHVYMATLLGVAAACGKLKPRQAWKMHVDIENARGRFSHLRTDATSKEVFIRFWQMLCKLHKQRDEPDWPLLLAEPGLDDLLLSEIKAG